MSLSVVSAQARTGLHVHPLYYNPYNPYRADASDLSWYAVRTYYGGPWSGPVYSHDGWDDYAKRYGIGCEPGTVVKGGDGIDYVCR